MNGKRIGAAWLMGLTSLAAGAGLVRAQDSSPAEARPAVEAGAGKPKSVEDVARERRELARKSLGILDATMERGAALGGLVEDYYYWSSRLVGCEIFLHLPANQTRTMLPEVYLATITPPPGDEILEAFRVHHRRMQSLEERFRKLEVEGILSPIAYQHILDHRIEAEIWLLREQARRQTSPPTSPNRENR